MFGRETPEGNTTGQRCSRSFDGRDIEASSTSVDACLHWRQSSVMIGLVAKADGVADVNMTAASNECN